MLPWLLISGVTVAVLLGTALLVGWMRRREGEAKWKTSMRGLTDFCERFAASRNLTCVSAVDDWPHGWPRIHGLIDDAAFSLAFGWQDKDVWVASIRVRAAGRARGDFRVVRNDHDGTPVRGRRVKTNDAEFDDVYVLDVVDGASARDLLTPNARRALLGIPGAEMSYRDGVLVLSWPCDAYLREGAMGDDDYASIEFGYDATAEVIRAARAREAYH